MAPTQSPRNSATRRSRKSIAHPPSSERTLDKENQTIHDFGIASQSRKNEKRSLRSQSLGAGELKALKEGSGNAQKIQPLPRSILKPTVPLSPLKSVVDPTRRTSPRRASNGTTNNQSSVNGRAGLSGETDSVEPATRVGLRTEEEQQAAARERERREVEQRREERRKSLANRRVSFAPEATLHTWDVVELPEDATSSTEATSSTRHGAGGSTRTTSPYNGSNEPMSDSSDTPSTPPEGEIQVAASPADKRNIHQQKRRRSSGIAPTDHNDLADFSSSPMSSVTSDDAYQSSMHIEDDVIDASDSDEDKDLEAEETVTSTAIDSDDVTGISAISGSSESGSHHLDHMLHEARKIAYAQNTSRHESEEGIGMDIVNDDTNPFHGDVQIDATSEKMNQDKASFGVGDDETFDAGDSVLDMEITAPVGGILAAVTAGTSQTQSGKRKSTALNRRHTGGLEQWSSGETMVLGDETMEFTTAIGSIQPNYRGDENQVQSNNEEMSMDFTEVVGGLQYQQISAQSDQSSQADYYQMPSLLDNDDMEMTVARGGILSPVTERTEPSDESAITMDFTAAVGAVLPPELNVKSKNEAKLLMEEEADHGQLTRSPFLQKTSQATSLVTAVPTAEILNTPTSSKSHIVAQRHLSASPNRQRIPSPVRLSTPLKQATTPRKQLTPQPGRPTTPSKTPPAKNVSMRKTSPKTLFKDNGKRSSSTPPSKRYSLSQSPAKKHNIIPGALPPNLVLTPRTKRQTSTVADKNGLGSPRVAAVLDRRVSIGEQAETFTPLGPGAVSVRFEDPRIIEFEVDRERAEDERRESGRGVLQMEANHIQGEDNDTTSNLRGMIDGLTPKKTKINGRKSLAVGAAKGILGKRPAELDEEDEDATPKRLRGIPHSPVKKIHLPAPPTKSETTGKFRRSENFGTRSTMERTTTPLVRASPRKTASTPNDQGRFRDTKAFQSAEKPPVSFNDQLGGENAETEDTPEDERIHLRDFLNMTSIRFMELTTTKRRQTVLPGKEGEDTTTTFGVTAAQTDDRSLPSCVVAGASTIPMLELYQHSCRELKKYIADGRSIVKEIEDDTYEDNPLLFREYMSAPPPMRAIMDNQFKNVKTHARLLSKGMWYEWRMKLLDGLQEGLDKIVEGLDGDRLYILKLEQILQPVMPRLTEEHENARLAASTIKHQAEELANCDQEELQKARQQLTGLDDEIAAIKQQVEALKSDSAEKDESLDTARARKAACLKEIQEAEVARETYRGWSASEVASLKDRVDSFENRTGWKVSAAHGDAVTFTYKSSISIYLTPSSFEGYGPGNRPNKTISLAYATENKSVSTIERFFLQLLRARVLAIAQAQTPLRQLLKLLENGWELARKVSKQMADLKALWPTEAAIKGDDKLCVVSTVLLRQTRTKIDAGFEILVGGVDTNIHVTINTNVSTIYGQDLKADKMAQVLRRECGAEKEAGSIGLWANALKTLEDKVTNYLVEKQAQ